MPIAGGTANTRFCHDADRLVGGVDADHVEGRHRHREVHRVPEPEPVLVRLAAALVEQRVVGVHLLPALAPRRGLRSSTGSGTRRAQASVLLIGNLPRDAGRLAVATAQRLYGRIAAKSIALPLRAGRACAPALDCERPLAARAVTTIRTLLSPAAHGARSVSARSPSSGGPEVLRIGRAPIAGPGAGRGRGPDRRGERESHRHRRACRRSRAAGCRIWRPRVRARLGPRRGRSPSRAPRRLATRRAIAVRRDDPLGPDRRPGRRLRAGGGGRPGLARAATAGPRPDHRRDRAAERAHRAPGA